MFEHVKSKLASKRQFRRRISKALVISGSIFIVSLAIGVLGYHYIARLNWTDAFLNASMILGGMGPVDDLYDEPSKIFAGCYALFSGISFLLGMGIIISPIVHRFMHRFHLDIEEDEKD